MATAAEGFSEEGNERKLHERNVEDACKASQPCEWYLSRKQGP